MIRRILIVCSGNTCRSPMAEALLRSKLAKHSASWAKDIVVSSAGVSAFLGGPASENAIAAMKNRNLDLSGHQSKLLEASDIINADLVITMTRNHKKAVLALVPEALSKVYTLAELTALTKAEPEEADSFRTEIREAARKLMGLEPLKQIRELEARREALRNELIKVEAELHRISGQLITEIGVNIKQLNQLLGSPPDIADPYGGDLAEYEECADSISEHLDFVLQFLDDQASAEKKQAPEQSAPEQTAPEQTRKEQSTGEQTMNEQTTQEQTAPEQAARDAEVAPDQLDDPTQQPDQD
jgi:protein-tyrosine-phosphatase